MRGIDPAPSASVLLEVLCRDPCAPRHTLRGWRLGQRGGAVAGASVKGGRGRAGGRGQGEEGQIRRKGKREEGERREEKEGRRGWER